MRTFKGISPMIATVLLIAFTVAVGGILSVWLASLTTTQTGTVGTAGEKAAQCGATSISVREVRYATGQTRVNVTITHSTGTQALRNLTISVTGQGRTNTTNATFTTSDFTAGESYAESVNVANGASIPPEIVTVRALCQTTYALSAECKSGQDCMKGS